MVSDLGLHCLHHTKKDARLIWVYTNFSMKYLVMCKVYTDVGGIKVISCLSTCM